MKPLHIDESFLVAGWCGSVLWGMYSVLFFLYFILLRFRKRNNSSGSKVKPTTIAIVIMYLLATAHLALMLYQLIIGFTRTSTVSERLYYFTYGVASKVVKTQNTIYVTISVIGDSIILWRLFIIWNRNYWISALPAMFILATCEPNCMVTVTGFFGSFASVYTLPKNLGSIRSEVPFRLLAASTVLSLASNLLLTGLIAGRIMYQSWRLNTLLGKTGRYLRLVLVIIESASVIVIARVFEMSLGTQTTTTDGRDPKGKNALYVITFVMPQIFGIVPLSMLIAVLSGLTSDQTLEENSARGNDVRGGLVFAIPTARTQPHSTT